MDYLIYLNLLLHSKPNPLRQLPFIILTECDIIVFKKGTCNEKHYLNHIGLKRAETFKIQFALRKMGLHAI